MKHIDDAIEAAREVAKETGTPLTPEEERHMRGIATTEPPVCSRCIEMGPEACERERERFKKEPFLSPCFDLGAQWTSHDDGATWKRFPEAENGWRGGRHLTVIAINADRGEVTFKVTP